MKLTIIILSLLCFESAFSKSIDSTHRFFSVNYSYQNLVSQNNYIKLSDRPFKNSYQNVVSILFQNKLYSYKKLNFNGYLGFSFTQINIGSFDVIQLSRKIEEQINLKSVNLSLNTGVSIDTRLIKKKRFELHIGTGIITNGNFYNPIKTKSFVFNRDDSYEKDSIAIEFNKNNVFEIHHFYQLLLKKKVKKSIFIIGIRYLNSFNGRPYNIEYRFFIPKISHNPINYNGSFRNKSSNLYLQLGFTF